MAARSHNSFQGCLKPICPWLRVGGLLLSAWIFADVFTSQCADRGARYCDSTLSYWVLGSLGWFVVPVALAILWVRSPLTRSGTVAAAFWLVGVMLVYHSVDGPREPGAEYDENWGTISFLVGTVFYAMYAGVTWLALWLIARRMGRE